MSGRKVAVRYTTVFFVILFISGFLSGPVFAADSSDNPMSPLYVNEILSVEKTPSAPPRGSTTLVINMTNPYNNQTMENISFTIGIYAFATIDGYRPLSGIEEPPILINGSQRGTEITLHFTSIKPGVNETLNIGVQMERKSPTGGLFNQGSYFVRMAMNFTLGNRTYHLLSRGFMSEEAKSFLDGHKGFVNSTELQQFGFDGIIPDTSFAVRVPIPKWPFYVLMGLAVLFTLAAVFSYVEDNPGAFPAIERRYLWLKGKYRWMRRKR